MDVSHYSSALMSDSKWRKLFTLLAEHSTDFSGIEYRFVDTEKVFLGSAPTIRQVWEAAIDDPVLGLGGPVDYKEIESLFIPKIYRYRRYDGAPYSERLLNLKAFEEELRKVGQFPLEWTNSGLWIYGYKI